MRPVRARRCGCGGVGRRESLDCKVSGGAIEGGGEVRYTDAHFGKRRGTRPDQSGERGPE